MGMTPLLKGRCPDAVSIQGLCIQGPKNGWCEWGHGAATGGGGRGQAGDANAAAVANAKAICAQCPVLDECRTWALSEPDPTPFMVTGGLTTAERRGVRRQARGNPIKHGTVSGYSQHYDRGELPPCDSCKEVRREWDQNRRAS